MTMRQARRKYDDSVMSAAAAAFVNKTLSRSATLNLMTFSANVFVSGVNGAGPFKLRVQDAHGLLLFAWLSPWSRREKQDESERCDLQESVATNLNTAEMYREPKAKVMLFSTVPALGS